MSRLQRDLTDSTVLRNVGVPMGHAVISIQSTLKGLRKLLLNVDAICVEVGYSLLPIVDESSGGNFLDRVVMLRKHFADEMGIYVVAPAAIESCCESIKSGPHL